MAEKKDIFDILFKFKKWKKMGNKTPKFQNHNFLK
jgi:hypothetical protein